MNWIFWSQKFSLKGNHFKFRMIKVNYIPFIVAKDFLMKAIRYKIFKISVKDSK